MAHMRQDVGALRWVPVELDRDRAVVIEVVRQNSRALQCTSLGGAEGRQGSGDRGRQAEWLVYDMCFDMCFDMCLTCV